MNEYDNDKAVSTDDRSTAQQPPNIARTEPVQEPQPTRTGYRVMRSGYNLFHDRANPFSLKGDGTNPHKHACNQTRPRHHAGQHPNNQTNQPGPLQSIVKTHTASARPGVVREDGPNRRHPHLETPTTNAMEIPTYSDGSYRQYSKMLLYSLLPTHLPST